MSIEAVSAVGAFEARWHAAEPAPRGSGSVQLICVRLGDSVHETPEQVEVTLEGGVEGDRWALGERPNPEAQVTLMNVRVLDLIRRDGTPLHTAGDNFLVDLDLAEDALPAGTRLRLGSAVLEVTPTPHTGCKKFRERFGLEALIWVNDHRDPSAPRHELPSGRGGHGRSRRPRRSRLASGRPAGNAPVSAMSRV